MRVLAGDVGGTNTRLAVCEVNDGKVLRVAEDVQPSDRFKTFGEIVREFVLHHSPDVRAACFGLPGPVQGRRAHLTNLPWIVDADQLERDLGLPSVSIINDLVANAHGLATLSDADFKIVRPGRAEAGGNAGLISAGTGLGEAGLQRVNGIYCPFATEGGHTDFAPTDELEWELLQFLQARHGRHISWERVVSGPGLTAIYEFLRDSKYGEEPKSLTEELHQAADPSSVIAMSAQSGRCDLTVRALDLFLQLYGAEAGNLALKVLATGGMYLGGGIAPKLKDALTDSRFVERFDDKGRLQPLVEAIPIRIVLNDKAALQGAALHAAQSALPRID